MSRNHIVVPRPPATRGPAVHSLVRAPSFPPGRMCDPRVPEAFQTDSQELAGGGCPEHREAAPPEPGAPRSCVRFPLGVIFPLRPPGPAALPRLSSSQLTAPPPRSRAAFGVARPPGDEAAAVPVPLPTAAPARPRRRRRPRPGDLSPASRARPPARPPSRTARAGPVPHPRQGEVGHELLEGPRLLGLPLRVQRDLLAELPRVGAARARRGGHGARPARPGSADGRRGAPRLGPPARSAGRPSRRPKPVLRRDPAEEPPRPQSPASGQERAEVRPLAPAPPSAPRSPPRPAVPSVLPAPSPAPRGSVRPPARRSSTEPTVPSPLTPHTYIQSAKLSRPRVWEPLGTTVLTAPASDGLWI